MSLEIEIGVNLPSDQRVTLDEDDLSTHNPVRTHTGKGDFSATVKGNRSLEKYAQRQDRFTISYNNGVEFTGYLTGVSHSPNSGTTKLRGDGIGKRLEETRPDYASIGGPVTYSNVALHDALRDYWPRTPFQNWTVTDQSTEVVAQGEQLQSADTTTEWENITTFAGSDPFVIQNGELQVAQTCDARDALDHSDSRDVSFADGDQYNDAQAADYQLTGQYIEFTFTTSYDIPADFVGIKIRDSVNNQSYIDYYWDNTQIDRNTAQSTSLGWSEIGESSKYSSNYGGYQGEVGNDIKAGDSHTLRIESTDSSSYVLDCVALYDTRYNYSFPNPDAATNAGGYLSGPELYPDVATIQFDSTTASFNVTVADITSTWNDTSNNQGLGVSNDNGDNWTRVNNTSSLSTSFSSPGREVVTEATFSRYGSRSTAFPTTGFNGQAIDSYNLTVDGNDLVVLVDFELSRNHFSNLQSLHDYGDFLWVIEHDGGAISDMVVSSFRRGAETRPAPYAFQHPKNKQPEIQSGTYYNSIYLEGAKQADGTRPTAEVKDQNAIDTDGREISPGVLRDLNISTEAGAGFRARALLDTAQQNNNLVGSVTTPPVMTSPGYARPIDMGDGEEYKTVEEVSLTLGTNSAEARFDFSVRSGFAEDISNLKRNARDIGNQV